MLRRTAMVAALSLAAAIALPARATPGEDAAKAYVNALELLGQSNLPAASEKLDAAVKDDPNQAKYLGLSHDVKKALKQEEALNKEQDPQKWSKSAAELREFYYQYEAFDAALKLDKARVERQKDLASKLLVAQTLTEMRKNTESAEYVKAIPDAEQTAVTRGYLAVALARIGKKEEAQALLDKYEIPAEADPQVLFLVASAHAQLGHDEKAIAAITRSLELTPPADMKARRESIGRSPDFNVLVHNGLFMQAMQTESKVGSSG